MNRHAIDRAYYELDKDWDSRMDLLPAWRDKWEKRDPLRQAQLAVFIVRM